ncbi:hypothetical protein B0T18DRAFT_413491 [Schizothecium vesticola]|uniref:F-box domain-containing protein n=1 Tax=Schizothecium vesticola TaxID=314040 RepID=A0AA40K1S7_9PEZI|nr:hypothetical protein B0T18DRAFT_413491 [Schizothecium vesticola]
MADTTTAVTAPLSGATILPQGFLAYKPFPFQRLPAEIRLMIYDLVFVSPSQIRLDSPRLHHRPIVVLPYSCDRPYDPWPENRYRPYGHDRGPERILPRGTMEMLLLNKTISAEIRHVLYTKNTFELTTKYHRAWFCTIGVPNARCVRSIIVHCGSKKDEGARRDLVAFHNTLVKRVPCLTDMRYMFLVKRPNRPSPGVDMLLKLPAPWMRLRFLQNIIMIVWYREIVPPARPDGSAMLQSLFRFCCPYTPTLLERTGLARKLANTARVKVRVGVDVRREKQSWTMWIEEREPEEPKRKLGAYPAIVMSSSKIRDMLCGKGR